MIPFLQQEKQEGINVIDSKVHARYTHGMKNSMKTHHIEWYSLDVATVLKRLATSPSGLTEGEAVARLRDVGENDLEKGRRFSYWIVLFSQFRSAFVYILLIAAGVSFLLHDTLDGWVILAAVILNSFVGVIQEGRAKKSLELLRKSISETATVVRDGLLTLVDTKKIVPGDVVVLSQGDRIPADLRLLRTERLMVNEAVFTGEAFDVEKQTHALVQNLLLPDQKNLAFAGSFVTSGTGRGVAVATGTATILGEISKDLKATEELTPFQKKLDAFGQKLGFLVFCLSLGIFIVGVWSGVPMVQMFSTAVAIAVSAIPEGLLVAVTVIMAIGMRRILKAGGLVKSLPAAETLGSTSVVCTDKTGTLTTGEMRVMMLATRHEYVADATHEWFHAFEQKPEELTRLLALATLSSDAYFERRDDGSEEARGNLTDRAILQFARGLGFEKSELEKRHPRLDRVPFDSRRAFAASLHEFENTKAVALKGSPEAVLALSTRIFSGGREIPFTAEARAFFENHFRSSASKALRVIAVAYKDVSPHLTSFKGIELYDFVFVGFLGIKDPLRQDVKESIQRLAMSHVRSVMVTGDSRQTALAIAKELGMHASNAQDVRDGQELLKMSETELEKIVPETSVFARVTPELKLKIIQAFQRTGDVVAMTGDGVNDAPALQKADIGIALGSGTDVAKAAADLVMLDNSFTIIEKALYEGRVIYENIKKVILYLLSDSFTELIIILVSIGMGWPLPLIASQILWTNLINDGLPAMALSQEGVYHEILKARPQEKEKPILERGHKTLIGFISALKATIALGFFFAFWGGNHASVTLARTVAFSFVGTSTLMYVFSIRSLSTSIFRIPFFSNPFLLAAVVFGFALQLVAVYVPFFQKVLGTTSLSLEQWGLILGINVLFVALLELLKGVYRRKEAV